MSDIDRIAQPNGLANPIIDSRLTAVFQQHLVRVCVDFTAKKRRHIGVYSGFLLELGNMFMWVTAGHVLEEIEAICGMSSYSSVRIGWADNSESIPAARIPFDFASTPKFKHNKDGIDIGWLVPHGLALEALRKEPNNVPFTEPAWRNITAEYAILSMYLVGCPREAVRPAVIPDLSRDPITIAMPTSRLRLRKIDPRTDEDPKDCWDKSDSFFAEIVPEGAPSTVMLSSIIGMSGGPVIALSERPDKKIAYHLVGIQSAWLPESRIIRATPISLLVEPLVAAYEEVRKELLSS